MAFLRPRPPELSEPISSISPSLAAQLEQCSLAVVFARDPAYRELSNRGSHFAALGEICHLLWEKEGRGEFDDLHGDALKRALNEAWDSTEREAVEDLRESLGGAQPPPPRRWPGYLTKRLGAIALVKRAVEARHEQPERVTGGARPSVEKPIELEGLRLRGRPDRIVWIASAAHIVDLKTCAAGPEMRMEHRRQLLVYAYLFHAQSGVWPAAATIQYIGGDTRTFEVDPEESEEVVAQILQSLDHLNNFAGEPEDLAQPSEDACRWCAFKAVCRPFYAAVDETWPLIDLHVLGTVRDKDSVGPRASLTVDVEAGNVAETRVVAVAPNAQTLSGVEVGDHVSIAGADSTRSPTTLRCDWGSVVCVWAQT